MTSYVIARTLGDPTASTYHNSSFAQPDHSKSDPNIVDTASTTAAILVTSPPPAQGGTSVPTGAIAERTAADTATTGIEEPPEEAHPPTYFVGGEGEDDGAARLAGVGVFSPVASMPGSPTLSRRDHRSP